MTGAAQLDTIKVSWVPGAAALEYDLCVKETFVSSKIIGTTEAGDKQKCNLAAGGDFDNNKGTRLGGVGASAAQIYGANQLAWDTINQTNLATDIGGASGNTATTCTEMWALSKWAVQCMQHKGRAQRWMKTDDVTADFNLEYRAYDIFTGWTFETNAEQPLASTFANVVVDFGKFRAVDEINLTGATTVGIAMAMGFVATALI